MASVGEQLLQPEAGWRRIEDTCESISYYQGNWTAGTYYTYSNSIMHYVTEDYTARLKFTFYGTKIRIISQAGTFQATDDSIVIDGEKSIINSYSLYSDVALQQCLVFEKTGLPSQLHEVEMVAGTNGRHPLLLDAVDIDDDGFLLSEEGHNKSLIYKDDKYYNISNSTLSEITDNIDASYIIQNGITLSDLNANLNLLDNTCKLVTLNKKFQIKGIKENTSMIVASNSFPTTIQTNIDYFENQVNLSNNGSIKLAFSIDNGVTWKSYKDGSFTDLSITIPLKPYKDLSESEITQWNSARDKIYSDGIVSSELSSIDFNSLDMRQIRFAYVLHVDNVSDSAQNKKLLWQFDAKGSMKKMKDTEVDIEVAPEAIKVTPLVDTSLVRVNISDGIAAETTPDSVLQTLMPKSTFVSETDDTAVKLADKAKAIAGVEASQPGQVYNRDESGDIGWHYPEIFVKGNTTIQRETILNAASGQEYLFYTDKDLDCGAVVQCWKAIEGAHIQGVLNSFTNNDSEKYYYNNENIDFQDSSIKINASYNINLSAQNDYYNSDEIVLNNTDYSIISYNELNKNISGVDVSSDEISENLLDTLTSSENENFKITTSSCESSTLFGLYKALNNNMADSWCNDPHDKNPWICIQSKNKKLRANELYVLASNNYTSVNGLEQCARNCKLQISDDGINWKDIAYIGDEIYTAMTYRKFTFHTYDFKYFRIYKENNTLKYMGIAELKLCYNAALDYKFLIKKNNQYYTILNDELTLVNNQDIINSAYIKENGFTNLQFNNLEDKPISFKLFCNLNENILLNYIASNKSLVVDKINKSTMFSKSIDYIKSTYAKGDTDNIKVVFTIDNGTTWKTYSNGEFADISIIIPQKEYNSLSEDELTQWNDARDTILSDGINIDDLENIDFNIEGMEKIRFAYVLNPYSRQSNCNITNINWQYDERNTYQMLSPAEVTAKQFVNIVKITPLADYDELRVNICGGIAESVVDLNNLTEEQVTVLKSKLGLS